MSCSGWPGYNGGYPLSKIHWDGEQEYYECDTTASQDSDYCRQWLTIEDGDDEWEMGQCQCTHTRDDNEAGREYCGNWSCVQIEVDKCDRFYEPLGVGGVAPRGVGLGVRWYGGAVMQRHVD